MGLTTNIHSRPKVLRLFTLIMINVIAVNSLRNLAIGAEYGFSLIFYYGVAALFFLIPIALVTAELSSGWPRIGGLYVWVREAFGLRCALVAVWLQWIYNIVWFPTILSFVAATLFQLYNPSLVESKTAMILVVMLSFWGATLSNCFGMKISGVVSTLGAMIGTLLPMVLIIVLAILWLLMGNVAEISFSVSALVPKVTKLNDLAFFVAILFGLLGIEMSAVHAEDVENPRKNFPKALFYSACIIVISLVCSSLAIAIVIPQAEINLVSGLSHAFAIFLRKFHLSWLEPAINLSILLGALCCVSAWIIGPTKGLLAATEDRLLPKIFCYSNRKGVPIVLLLLQGVIFTGLCSVFFLMPTISSSYWILSAMTAQMAMIVYMLLFATAIRLRYCRPSVTRTFKIPGGNGVIWFVAGIGFVTCCFTLFIGFFPPDNFSDTHVHFYGLILASSIVVFCCLPLLFSRRKAHKKE